MKKFNSKKSGFTLIELIVVIAIIGILIAITVPRLATYIQTAQVTSERAGAKTVYTAAVAYNTTQNAPATGDLGEDVLGEFVDANAEIVLPSEVKARGQYGVNVAADGTYTVTYWDVSANNGAGATATMVDGAIDTTTAS